MTRSPSPPVLLLALLLALGAAPASAQMYRYIAPDGRTVFADTVPPGARQVEKIAPADEPSPQEAEAARQQVRQQLEREKAEVEQIQRRQERFDAAYDQMKAAERELEAARQRQKDGEEPLPGERVGNRGGGSRLRETYFQRQDRLKADVQQAEQRVEALRAKTRALE